MSIRARLLLLLASALIAVSAAQLALALKLFHDDKVAYVYDIDAAVAATTAEQLRSELLLLQEKLARIGASLAGAGDAADVDAQEASADAFLVKEPDIVRLDLQRLDGERATSTFTRANGAALDELALGTADLDALASSRLLPLGALKELSGMQLANASLPPDAALLLVAVPAPDSRALIATVRARRFLRLLDASPLVDAYVVGANGEVLVHPDRATMVKRASLAARPVVATALTERAARGVRVFDAAADGGAAADHGDTRRVGAFARLGIAGASVVSEIPEAQALRAARELTWRSGLFAGAILLLALGASAFFAKRLTAPLVRLRDAALSVGKGKLDVDVDAVAHKGGDEIAELGRAFKGMTAELKSAQALLVHSERLAAIGELGAGIAHEVKNPMTTVLGMLQLARRKPDDAARVAELLTVGEREAERCVDILNSLLRLARVEGPHERVGLAQIVDDAMRLVRHDLERHGVALEVEHRAQQQQQQGEPALLVRPPELHQVLLNLAINARQALGSARATPEPPRVHVVTSVSDDGKSARIAVSDNGPGVPDAIKRDIFKPFFSTKSAGEGTGLGLAVCARIIAGHGGTLAVDDADGGGARFTVMLPLAPAAAS